VKPTPDSPLLRLGVDKMSPLVNSAILLDARTHVGGGEPMSAGQHVTPEHIEAMPEAAGLAERGILPGDIVLIYTGWSDHYEDPDTSGVYYSMAPGLSYESAQYLGERRIVAAGLDTPFVDAVAEGQLAGTSPPPLGTPVGMVFPVHEHFLTEVGVHTLEGRGPQAQGNGRRRRLGLLRDGTTGADKGWSRRSDQTSGERDTIALESLPAYYSVA